ncbi:MAG: hypothetical protein B6U94_05935 [Thermofilum sp. ex4484_79]|nr:MAG: hypothetical protein B6U94_05935 [Thermofilum sp. ex4484_79]
MRCRECEGKIVVNPEGFYVCSECGLIQEEYIPFEFSNEKEGESIYTFDYIGSFVDREGKHKEYVISKLHLYYGRGQLYKYSHYNILKEFNSICEILKIPHSIRKKAIRIYYRLIKEVKDRRNKKKIFHFKYLATSLILALRDSEFEIPYKDVLGVFNSRGHTISKSELMEAFNTANKIGLYKRFDIARLVRRYSKIILVNLPVKNISSSKIAKDVNKEITRLLNIIDFRAFSGKNPHIIAIAVVYLALRKIRKKYGIRVSVRKISEIVGYSQSAVRSNSLLILKYLKSRKPYIGFVINQ